MWIFRLFNKCKDKYFINELKCCQTIREMSKVTQKTAKTTAKTKTSTSTNPNLNKSTSNKKNKILAEMKIEILPEPLKSENDRKDYKVIRLSNGLTACLISDVSNWQSIKDKLENEEDSEIESEGESSGSVTASEEETEHEDDDNEDSEMKKVPQIEEKMASAALCIGVGSFSDPKNVPGMAHFLEHMVFMGSEKFPPENDFDSFIKKRGGSDNASTDCETTTFYFECLEKHLHRGLDKFAQFFIAPLMMRESMTREREAIDSEFQMALPSDAYRKEQLLCSLARNEAPVNTFTWGNLVTLRDNVSDDALYEGVHEFRKRHYSAHRMTLAIQARLPMDVLESLVIECFSTVPNNNLPADDFTPFANAVFNTSTFKRMYYVKPVKDLCQIDLTWSLPSLLSMYKSKPHVYVSWILGHEGKGSLLSALREKVWALDLYTGNGETGMEHNSMYSFFTTTLILTEQGLQHLSEVIEMVFSYIRLLKEVGPQERIFKEIQLIDDTSFRFTEEKPAVDTVDDLAEAMQIYPSEHYIAGSELYFEYDPKAIEMVTDHLTPDDVNIMILSTTLPENVKYNKKESWFNTAYTDRDIPQRWKDLWSNAKPMNCFALPEPNIFITTDFNCLPVSDVIPDYPQKILKNDQVELWYRQDNKFKLPIAYYYFYLITPMSVDTPACACMLDMYVGLLSLLLNEEAFPAHVAELSYNITTGDRGIIIRIDGYNEKLPVLIALISKHISNFTELLCEDMFNAYKDKLVKHYYNNFLKPARLAKDVRMSVLLNVFWSSLDKHKAVSSVTYEDMQKYSDNLTKRFYVQVLIQGNVSRETAITTTEKFLNDLNCGALDTDTIPKIRVSKVPNGERCCRAMSFNSTDTNSIITNYYQSGPSTFKNCVIIELLMMLLEEPLFDILRTKEQLGYSVSCTIRDTFGVLGYSITVNAQALKNSTQYVDKRIENFVKHGMKLLKKMPEKKLNQMKRDLIQIKQCADVHLKDEVSRNWGEISMQDYIFDRLKQEIAVIEEIKINDLRKWWEEHNSFGNKNNFCKLSVQIVGHNTSENHLNKVDKTNKSSNKLVAKRPSKESQTKDGSTTGANNKYSLQLMVEPKEVLEGKAASDYFVTNISEFRKKLYIFPNNHNHSPTESEIELKTTLPN